MGITIQVFKILLLILFITDFNSSFANSSYDNSKIKDIINVIDKEPVLNKEMLLLGKYMSDNLLASLSSCYQVMLPKALKAEVKSNIKIKYDRYLHRIKSIEEIDRYIGNCKYESQINLLCKLKEGDILITKMSSSINTIIKYGFASIIYEECKRYKYDGISNYKRVNLTDKQRLVSDTIISSFGKSDTFLLYGVTGSGHVCRKKCGDVYRYDDGESRNGRDRVIIQSILLSGISFIPSKQSIL